MVTLSTPGRIPPSPSASLKLPPVTRLFATLIAPAQITEKKTTLTSVFATLTSSDMPKSIVCHSYKKRPGWGIPSNCKSAITTQPLPSFSTPSTHSTRTISRNLFCFHSTTHGFRHHGGVGCVHPPIAAPRLLCHNRRTHKRRAFSLTWPVSVSRNLPTAHDAF